MAKVVSLSEAVSKVKDGDALLVGGFGSYAGPDELLEGLAARYDEETHPKGLTVLCGITPGDKTESTEPGKGFNIGLNRLKADGLIDTFIAGNLTDARAIAYMVGENKIACWLPPLGVMMNLFRAAASGRPGVLTKIGMKTFADPRLDGCAFNERAKTAQPIVELINIDGDEYLLYKTFKKANVAFIRATYADEDGNLSMAKEAVLGPELDMAVAAHNKGGIVIAQVEQIVKRGALHAKQVRVHSSLVDYIVVTQNPYNHRQSYAGDFRPELSGDIKLAGETVKALKPGVRKQLARRGALELKNSGASGRVDTIVNLGSGIPGGIGSVAVEEGISFCATVEAGSIGGIVQEGLSFPGVANADSYLYQLDMLDIYDGGYINMCFLGFAEVDERGNTNVSYFAGRAIGAGGYINISQSTKKVCFMGSLVDINKRNGIETSKFVKQVQHITFSGDFALEHGQEVLYITERAVFRLIHSGLELIEIAPGIDVETDVIAKMGFRPEISVNLKIMDDSIFNDV
ncbi:MAG: malonate decarboxylase subunit alpha [Oscillospiraceae bacterium]|jgi:propionate CoA-transferase|nr:malonate decarboxylase subunit alpha [Oscillospiraceae bacterium]